MNTRQLLLSQSQPREEHSKFKREMGGLFNFQRHFWIFYTIPPREDNVTLGGGNWIVLAKLVLTQSGLQVIYCFKLQK